MKTKNKLLTNSVMILCASVIFASCTVVTPGEVGVVRRLGKLSGRVLYAGPHVFDPFTSKVVKLPIRTVNLEVSLDLPSKEGLLVKTEISILYHIESEKVPAIITTIGDANYEEVVIMSVFRSAAANISSQFYAKDMHTSERAHIENGIKERMDGILEPRGFVIESVLLKSIRLPQGLAQSIEQKLESEQDAQRMEFVLQKEKQEAQRKRVEAEGIKDAQKIIAEGLTPQIIEWRSIEAFKQLSTSPNTKIIITDGKTPFLVNPGTSKNKIAQK